MYITIFNVFWIDRANVTESSTLHKTRLNPDQAIVKSEVGMFRKLVHLQGQSTQKC